MFSLYFVRIVAAAGASLALGASLVGQQPKHRILTSDASKKIVAILDEDGKVQWQSQTNNLHDLHLLPNGNVLFQTDWTKIVEVNPITNEMVWQYDSAQQGGNAGKKVEVHAFQRLPNGLTMIAESGPARIIEVDYSGAIVSQIALKVDKTHPHRDTRLVRKLPNGNYLVCHEGLAAVREYNSSGEVVWQFDVPLFGKQPKSGHGLDAFGNQCFAALRLENGNTLISTGNGHSVLEVNLKGEIVWQLQQDDLPGIRLAWVTTLQQLPNGNLVIGNCHAGKENPQVIEITRDKKVVWVFHDFERFGNSLTNTQILSSDGSKNDTTLKTQRFQRIETIAGNGQKGPMAMQGLATSIALANPFGVDELSDGSLAICAFDWHVIYRLHPDSRQLELVAGTGRQGSGGVQGQSSRMLEMNQPHELQVDSMDNIYVADTMNHRVLKLLKEGTWQPIAGTGLASFGGDGEIASKAGLNQAYSIALEDQRLLVVDLKNHRLREIGLTDGLIRTICGTGSSQLPKDGELAIDQPLADPRSVAIDADNIWVLLRSGHSLWRIDRKSKRIYHVAGTGKKGFSGDQGPAVQATLNGPKGIAVDPGVAIYIADTENHAVRVIDLTTGRIDTLVGSTSGELGFNGDGVELQQRLLSRPHGLCLLRSGDLIIGDSENHRVRRLTR